MQEFNIQLQGFNKLFSQWLREKIQTDIKNSLLFTEIDPEDKNARFSTQPVIRIQYCMNIENLNSHLHLTGSKTGERMILWWGGNEPGEEAVIKALNLGVSAVVSDKMEWEDIIQAITGVSQKEIHFNEIVSEALYHYCSRNRVLLSRKKTITGQLGEREKKVIQLRRSGKTSREIAGLLFLSKKTIDKVFGDLYRRFDCNNFLELLNAFEGAPVHDSAAEGVPDLNSLR